MGVDRQHDNVPLHELLGRLEREGERLRLPGNRLELLPNLYDAHRGRQRAGAGRAGERYVWRFVAGQLWIVALVDCAYPVRDLRWQLRQNENPIQRRQTLLELRPANRIRTEW